MKTLTGLALIILGSCVTTPVAPALPLCEKVIQDFIAEAPDPSKMDAQNHGTAVVIAYENKSGGADVLCVETISVEQGAKIGYDCVADQDMTKTRCLTPTGKEIRYGRGQFTKKQLDDTLPSA